MQGSLHTWIIVYLLICHTYHIPNNVNILNTSFETLSVYFSPLEISRMPHTFLSHFGKESFLACRERGSDIEISTKRVCPLSVLTGICAEEMLTQAAFYMKYIPVAKGSGA